MVRRTRDAEAELNLPPGFRFHPTDEELVVSYLCRKVARQRLPVPIIAEVDLYKFDPWQLPEKALFGSKEWYFFTPRDRKYPNGLRPNRAAGGGYWKATGADRPVVPAGSARALGIKKALVFYTGKAPKSAKTNWIMHEYRLADGNRAAGKAAGGSQRLDDWVLCRLYNKKNNWGEETRQPAEESSTGNAAVDSFEAGGNTGSETFRTPESDVDNGDCTEGHDGVRRPFSFGASAGAARASRGSVVGVVKEETDWFTDLNLDDLQSSLTAAGGAPPLDLSYQDCYLLSLASPQLKPGQNYLPPF